MSKHKSDLESKLEPEQEQELELKLELKLESEPLTENCINNKQKMVKIYFLTLCNVLLKASLTKIEW